MIEFHIVWYLFAALILKIFILGGGFDLWDWFRYGKKYSQWYKNREKFENYLEWADDNDESAEEEDDWYSRTFD